MNMRLIYCGGGMMRIDADIPEPIDADYQAFHPADDDEPSPDATPRTSAKTFRQLQSENPAMGTPVIHGLLRRGEIANVVAASKMGKTWLVDDIALAVVTGSKLWGTFPTVRGNVLIVDNELHPATIADRIPRVASARGMDIDDYADSLHIESLRGQLKDIDALDSYFRSIPKGAYSLIIIDALYRIIPKGSDENSNGDVCQHYNKFDQWAAMLDSAIMLVHHSSKGSQAGKVVTDVGSGAGAQSRAADAHIVLRHHAEPDCVVVEAAGRSFKPMPPMVLRWTFPVFNPDLDLDPSDLRKEGKPARQSVDVPDAKFVWTVEAFVARFVRPDPRPGQTILDDAEASRDKLSARAARCFLRVAEDRRLVHRWTTANPSHPVRFATVLQPVSDTGLPPEITPVKSAKTKGVK